MLATGVAARAGIDGNDGRSEALIQQQIAYLQLLPMGIVNHSSTVLKIRTITGKRGRKIAEELRKKPGATYY